MKQGINATNFWSGKVNYHTRKTVQEILNPRKTNSITQMGSECYGACGSSCDTGCASGGDCSGACSS